MKVKTILNIWHFYDVSKKFEPRSCLVALLKKGFTDIFTKEHVIRGITQVLFQGDSSCRGNKRARRSGRTRSEEVLYARCA